MHRVFSVNVFGTMATTRAVLPIMRAQGRGRIVMMSSIGGKLPALGSSAYCASKFALEGFAQTLAQEVRPFGVRVSLIQPGFVNTELFGRNRQTALRAMAPDGPYRDWFLHLEDMTDRLVSSPSASTVEVAEAVYRALTVRRPRMTYIVGGRTKALIAFRRHLPGDLFDRIWTREAARRIQKTRS
jgi:NAD(P)-dependent dehydrogenase (short-subunit alcohol dehydrogenase family)